MRRPPCPDTCSVCSCTLHAGLCTACTLADDHRLGGSHVAHTLCFLRKGLLILATTYLRLEHVLPLDRELVRRAQELGRFGIKEEDFILINHNLVRKKKKKKKNTKPEGG